MLWAGWTASRFEVLTSPCHCKGTRCILAGIFIMARDAGGQRRGLEHVRAAVAFPNGEASLLDAAMYPSGRVPNEYGVQRCSFRPLAVERPDWKWLCACAW